MEFVGIYARISVVHTQRKEESIENQILLARKWLGQQICKGALLEEYDIYIDRGYSGTDFSRPGFQKLLRDAKAGKLQCILCKDYSRLGRDYLKTGELIERVLPAWGIRLVCISDRYDSSRGLPGSLEGSLRNLMNEWYAKDIGRKVHLVKEQKKKEGNYLGSVAPYGYEIVQKEGRRMLQEEKETMDIVHQICQWNQQGMKIEEIRNLLQSKGVLPPVEYRKKGRIKEENILVKKWDRGTLYRVIAHQRGLLHD